MQLNGFLAKNNQSRKIPYLLEFDETPRFWYPRVTLVAWIDFTSYSNETDSPISVDLRKKRKPFFFSSLSLFCSFSPLSFLHFLSFSPFLSTELPLCLFPSSFLFNFPFTFFFLFFSHTQIDQSGGSFPPLSSFDTCHPHIFSLIFLIFLSFFFLHLTLGSM